MTTKLLIDRELMERIPLDVLKTYGYAQTAHKIESILAAAPAQGQQVEWRTTAVMLEQANAGLAQLNGKLRAELSALKAQQVGQEPFGYLADDGGTMVAFFRAEDKDQFDAFCAEAEPLSKVVLYTTPQPAPAQDVAEVLEPGKIVVSAEPLRRVLNALVNAPHRIRELQVTREPVELFADNPINILIAEFEAAHDKQSGGKKS